MARAYATIAFTDAVRARQAAHGSAGAYARALAPETPAGDRLGPDEAAFVAARDGFYIATVSETGWPYIQHRGGPAGFLRVLDDRTLGFADFRGNRQYLSAGNIDGNPRVALFLMDYPNRRRLKVMGRARLVETAEDPALAEALAVPGYPGRPERAMLITVAGFDWNCPQHITPRFSAQEIEPLLDPALAPLRAELETLREENARLRALAAAAPQAGA